MICCIGPSTAVRWLQQGRSHTGSSRIFFFRLVEFSDLSDEAELIGVTHMGVGCVADKKRNVLWFIFNIKGLFYGLNKRNCTLAFLIHGDGFFYYSLETKFYTCWMQMRWAKKNIFCGVIMMCFDANEHQCSSINDFLIRYYHIMSHMKV